MMRIKVETECEHMHIDFATSFRWQYLLTQRKISPTDLTRHSFSEWNLYVGDGVHVATLEDVKGRKIGLFLGIGVDHSALIQGNYRIESLDLDRDRFFEDFEAWLFYIAGRYNVFIAIGEEKRFYSDPVGMNGTVYDRDSRQIASSLALCLERAVVDHPLYDHSYIESGEGNYSLFHTRDKHARRGNPNCYIDLNEFTETRFWPHDESFHTSRSRQDIYAEIISRTSNVIKHINSGFKTALPLSGGQDSRLLAAMAGEDISGIDQTFTHITNYASRIDATIAAKIAEVLEIDHEVYDRRIIKLNKNDLARNEAQYHMALGMKRPVQREVAQGLHEGVTDRAIVLRGHQTDLLRAVFIDKMGADGRNNLRWQIKRLLIVPAKKFDRQIRERFEPEYRAWIETLPKNVLERQIDLMFLEIYYSSTVGTTFPAISRNFFMSPFNSRHLISLALSIEEGYRRDSFAVNDILLMQNSQLHDVPFDYEFGGKRGLENIDDHEQMIGLTRMRRKSSEDRLALMKNNPNIAASAAMFRS